MTRPPRRDACVLPAEPAPALTAATFSEEDEVLAAVLAEIVAHDEDAVTRGAEISDLVETLHALLDTQGADLLDRIIALSEISETASRGLAARLAFEAGRVAGGPCPVCETVHAETTDFADQHALGVTLHAILREDFEVRRLGREVTRCRGRLRAAVTEPTWGRALELLRAVDARESAAILVLARWGYERGLRRGRELAEGGA